MELAQKTKEAQAGILTSQEALRLIREEHAITVKKDDPILAYVTVGNALNSSFKRLLEAAAAEMTGEMTRLSQVTEAAIRKSLADLSESAIKTSMEQVLAEVVNKARQDSELAQRLEARLALNEQRSFRLFKKAFWSILILTLVNLTAAAVQFFY